MNHGRRPGGKNKRDWDALLEEKALDTLDKERFKREGVKKQKTEYLGHIF